MPPLRRSNLGRKTRNATNQGNYRSNQSAQERDDLNEREIIRISQTSEARARHSTNNNKRHFSRTIYIYIDEWLCVN